MRLLGLMGFFCLLILSTAAASSLDVDIKISPNNIITQTNTLVFEGEGYERVEFETAQKPLSVDYGGAYEIIERNESYIISLEPKSNVVSFDLYFDNLIDSDGKRRVYRSSFAPPQNGIVRISLTLPTGFVLSERKPNAIPQAADITTDGRAVTLKWVFTSEQAISVFYEGGEDVNLLMVIGVVVLCVIIMGGAFFYVKRRNRRQLSDMLSSEEGKVIEAVRAGLSKQKDVAAQLVFSKSKMSKIVRHLEEKGLITRTPHFKTNIIKLKEKIR